MVGRREASTAMVGTRRPNSNSSIAPAKLQARMHLGVRFTFPHLTAVRCRCGRCLPRFLGQHRAALLCGVCTVFCPEGCITMRADGYPEADMEYCKGCGICVAECWTGCIRMEEEAD